MRNEISAIFDSLTPKAGVCVADGYGIRIFVHRRHLIVEDGVGPHRRERTFARATAGIKRVIVLGHAGFVTLDALRWMSDVGIAFIQIDRDGPLIGASTPPGNDDARLRRDQALARDTELGREVATWILDTKLRGQAELLAALGADEAQAAVARARRGLIGARSTDALMSTPEARAAAAYWGAWASLPIEFARKDRERVPVHWLTFGARRSPLSGSPRLAANPANAILNYLYRMLEAETRLACLAVGLDPGLGFFHKDKRGRDNLVMDLMEACRPEVDAYALQLFQSHIFRAADFHDTRKGVCRVLAPVTHELAETSLVWMMSVAPIAEGVARMVGKPRRIRKERPPTPLTKGNRSAGRDGIRRKPKPSAEPPRSRGRACRHCGQDLRSGRRQFCDNCLMLHGDRGESALKRAAAMVRQRQALAEWRQEGYEPLDPHAYRDQILPHLGKLSLRQLVEATGLSEAYCSKIRRGAPIPHPRHWGALGRLVDAVPR